MAVLTVNGKDIQIDDASPIGPLCEREGLVFNCHTGVCGSCLVTIVEGCECLSPLTDEELSLGLDETRRLACRCSILRGRVVLTF